MVLFLWLGTGTNSLYGQNALNFDGTNDFVNCGNAASLQLSTGTIEAWIKTSNAGAGFRGIVVKNSAYGLFMNDNVLIGYSWGSTGIMTTNVSLNDNAWHHVAMSFQSGVTNGTRIYIDGVLRATSLLTVSTQTTGLSIGSGATTGGQNFTGNIEDVRIWSTVRTATEIANNRGCELVGTETGLVSYYKMNQGTASGTNTGITTLNDAKGSSNGTLTNFALTGATSNWVTASNSGLTAPTVSIVASATNIAYGTSVTFTATPSGGTSPTYQWKKNGNNVGTNSTTYTDAALLNSDVITCVMTSNNACSISIAATSNAITMSVTYNNALAFNGGNNVTLGNDIGLSNTDFTIEVWIKANGTGNQTVISNRFLSSTDNWYTFGIKYGVFALEGQGVYVHSPFTPANTNWNHIAVTRSGTTYKFYVNGQLENEFIGTATSFVGNSVIGSWADGSRDYLNGALDELRIWNVARTKAEIQANVNTQLSACNLPNLTHYYKFDNGIPSGNNTAATTLTDCAGTYNGTLLGFTLTSGNTTSNWINSTASTNITSIPSPTVSISTNATTVIQGTNVTFTATLTNGGATATIYQWKKNGTNVGSNASTYSDATLQNGDVITCNMMGNPSYLISPVATSNSITMTVTATPSVSIVASPSGTITTGTSVTFTATPTNGGTTPTYQWKKGSTDVGTNSAIYTDATLANGDIISCIMTSSLANASPITATSNSITMTVVAPTPNALHFDGTNDYVALPNINPISSGTPGQYTVETWVKLNAYTSGIGCWIYGDETGGNGGIIMQISSTGYIWTFRAATGIVTSTAQVPLNTWTHIAFVQDASNLKLYVNGVFIQNLLSGANLNLETTNPPKIGALPDGSRALNGMLDEMRIWNVARTATEIANNYSCQLAGSESGLVAYYKFNQGVAESTNTGLTTLTDATANGNNGTLTNFALTGTTSNWVSSSVSTSVTPSVSIAANPVGTITSGTSVTFTATPTNGGAAPSYQWEKNGNNVGTNNATYTDAALVNNDVIACVMTSSVTCANTATANSNNITMTVNAVLPIELLSFNGQVTERGNLLTWQTANETNNKGFQVERLNAAGNDWDILGFVKAQGKEASYNFTDNTPLSMSYYRLRQIDNDGKETLSTVIFVSTKSNNNLKVYPNPVSNILTIENAESGDFQILNLLGQQVMSGKATQRIDVSALPQGAYFLKVGREQLRFVKQ